MNKGITKAMGATLALVIAGTGAWLFSSDDFTTNADNDLPSADGAALLDTEQRLSRLEDEIRTLKVLVSHGTRDAGLRPVRQAPRAEGKDPAQQRENFRSALSSSFAAQPVDSAWARRTRITLEDQLLVTTAEQPDFPAPRSTRMQCRSATCRIEAEYPDEDSALYGVQLLQSAFSPQLPRTHQYSVNHPDGSVTVVMYASKGPT